MGHIVSETGIKIDPARFEAISKFPKPCNKKELLQWLGMVNFAGRFIPNKSIILEPLNQLLKNDVMFVWSDIHNKAFNEKIFWLSKVPCLSYFDVLKQIVISADASSYSIGAVLLQINKNGEKEIIMYASRALSVTERRYAQIEREARALTWACKKFQEYVVGITVSLETDHKPLL